MLQASFLDCQFLDLLPFSEDGFSPTEVNIGRRDVVQALVVAVVVVVLDEGFDLPFQIAGQVVVLQHEEGQGKAPVGRFPRRTVLHGLMPALDFALGLCPLGDAGIACQVIDGRVHLARDPYLFLPANRPDRPRRTMSRCR